MYTLLLALALSQVGPLPTPLANRNEVQRQSSAPLLPPAGPVFPANQQPSESRAADSGERSGADTLIQAGILVVMLLQGGLFFRQLEIMDEQGRLAKEQFYAVHRARLTVRKVYYANPNDGYAFEVELADTGFGGAQIEAFAVAYTPILKPSDTSTWRLKAALDAVTVQRSLSVPPNGSQVIRTNIPEVEAVLAFEVADEVYAVGYVVYRNGHSEQRYRLGFIRSAPRVDRIFRRVDRHEFEYSD